MSTYSLSGSGTHALTASTTGLQVTITTPSVVQGVGTANPANHYHTGMLRFSDGTAYWDPVPITGGPQFIPVPQNATSFGYSMQGGAAISVVEVIGGTVFFSAGTQSVETLSDVQVAAIADGQVLKWNAAAGKWENATLAGGALSTASAQLAADVTITPVNTFVDGPSVSLAAGTWLIIAVVTIYSATSQNAYTAKLWDGTTTVDSSECAQPFLSTPFQIVLSGVVNPGITTTYKISVAVATAGSTDGKIKAAVVHNSAGNTASSISALKVA